MNKDNTPAVVEKDGKKYKVVQVKSALPIWAAAAVWLLAPLIFPMYNVFHLLIVAALSVGAALLVKKILPKETKLVEIPFYTGNHDLDETVKSISAALSDLKSAAERIASAKPETARRLRDIAKTIEKIRDALITSPDDLPKVRRFLNYYLPRQIRVSHRAGCEFHQHSRNLPGY